MTAVPGNNQPIQPKPVGNGASNFQTYMTPNVSVPQFQSPVAGFGGATATTGTTSSYLNPTDTYAKSTVKDADNALLDSVNRRLKEKGYMSGYTDIKTAIESAPSGTDFRKELESLKTNYDSASSVGDKFAVINQYNTDHPAAATNAFNPFGAMPAMPNMGMGGMPMMPGMGGMPGANPAQGLSDAAKGISDLDKKEKAEKDTTDDRKKLENVEEYIKGVEKAKTGAEDGHKANLQKIGDSYETGLKSGVTKQANDIYGNKVKNIEDLNKLEDNSANGLIQIEQLAQRKNKVDNVYGTEGSAKTDKNAVITANTALITDADKLINKNTNDKIKPNTYFESVKTNLESANSEKNIGTVEGKSVVAQNVIDKIKGLQVSESFTENEKQLLINQISKEIKKPLDSKITELNSAKNETLNKIVTNGDTEVNKVADKKETVINDINTKAGEAKKNIIDGKYNDVKGYKVDEKGNLVEDANSDMLKQAKARCEKSEKAKEAIVAEADQKLTGGDGKTGLVTIKENIQRRIDNSGEEQSKEDKKKEDKEIGDKQEYLKSLNAKSAELASAAA